MAFSFAAKPTNTNTFNAFNSNTNTNSGGGFGNFGTTPSSTNPTSTNMFGNVNKTSGVTGSFGGFGTGGGFSSASQQQLQQEQLQQQQQQQQQQQLQQQFPYHGIKGPGHSPSWQRNVDFTQITESTSFETLPKALQEHLNELRQFMNMERASGKKMFAYFNETDTESKTSYRTLLQSLSALQVGKNSIDHTLMSGKQQARHNTMLLRTVGEVESMMKEYVMHTWENVRRKDVTVNNLSSNVAENYSAQSSNTNNFYCGMLLNEAESENHQNNYRFSQIQVDLTQRLNAINDQIEQLRIALHAPPINRSALLSQEHDCTNTMSNFKSAHTPNTHCVSSHDHWQQTMPNFININSLSGVNSKTCTTFSDYLQPDQQTKLSCNNNTCSVNHAFSDNNINSSNGTSDNAVMELNTTFKDEIASVTALTSKVAELHARCSLARQIFIQHYGNMEAEMLFKPFTSTQQTYLHWNNNINSELKLNEQWSNDERRTLELEQEITVTSPLYSAASPTAPTVSALPSQPTSSQTQTQAQTLTLTQTQAQAQTLTQTQAQAQAQTQTQAQQLMQQPEQPKTNTGNIGSITSTTVQPPSANTTTNTNISANNNATFSFGTTVPTASSTLNATPASTSVVATTTMPGLTNSMNDASKHVGFTFSTSTEQNIERPARRTRERE